MVVAVCQFDMLGAQQFLLIKQCAFAVAECSFFLLTETEVVTCEDVIELAEDGVAGTQPTTDVFDDFVTDLFSFGCSTGL
jgi:hypothetical protein